MSTAAAPKRAVIYARVSLDHTGEGRSIERQVDACRKLAELRGWSIVTVKADNSISAWSGKSRPAWKETLGMVERGEVDVIVSWHIDRMTRSMTDLEHLILLAEKQNVAVATATGDIDLTTDVGRMVARILAAVARAEVERKAQRQKLANAHRAQEGLPHVSSAPPGYLTDGLTLVPEEAKIIRSSIEQALNDVPLAHIGREWSEGKLLKGKDKWTPPGVRKVLTNPKYAGILMFRGEAVGQGKWQPIVSLETHLAVASKLLDPTRSWVGPRGGPIPTTLLSSLAKCGVCEKPMRAAKNYGTAVYGCIHAHQIPTRDEVDDWVHARMITFLAQETALTNLAPATDATDEAKRERGSIHARRTELTQAMVRGDIPVAQYELAQKMMSEREAELDKMLLEVGTAHVLRGLRIGKEEVAEDWLTLPLARQRAIVDALFEVVLLPRGKGNRETWDGEKHARMTRRIEASV